PRGKRALAACQRAVAKAVTLTRQLMTFGTAQPGLLLVVDLRRWLPALNEMLRGALRETIAVTIEVDPATSPVQIDPVQFELAILNLALNARDAMNGHGVLRISAANRRLGRDDVAGLPAGEFVAITVADNGSGIPPEVLGRVFEPFFTTKPVGKGTGLGLSLSYGIVRKHHGQLEVRSESGVGTTFRVTVPVQGSAAP
ncbi:MAG TPA: ATP-binding protein, partial [Burkholderiaceae bacterium]|nr:ATP-binding protein [Burkholderiaceae bacterium]